MKNLKKLADTRNDVLKTTLEISDLSNLAANGQMNFAIQFWCKKNQHSTENMVVVVVVTESCENTQ